MKKTSVDTEEISDQAIRYVRSNPCSICCYDDSKTHKCNAGIKHKGTCKVARILRDELWKLRTSDERKEK